MQKISVRTLTLLLLLLASVLVHQYIKFVPSARADATWLAVGDPNDPNQEPGPERGFSASGSIRLDDDPNEPGPERAWSQGPALTGDDPNEPTDPGPERA